MQDYQDAYGHEVYDYWRHGQGFEIVERDDGYFALSGGPAMYFATYECWPPHYREAMACVRGRVLDIGCGVGRHALYLQEQGHEVVAIDSSPLAVQVAKERGVRKVHELSITRVSSKLGQFDTIIMMGNNFGLLGDMRRGRWLLKRFHSLTSEAGRIIAETTDPYDTTDPDHLSYHEFNRQRGRLGGQLQIRIRYKQFVTPWFDYWLASRHEVEELVHGTGWQIERFIASDGPQYVVILKKA